MAEAVGRQLTALAELLLSVVQDSLGKRQRRAEALGCACGILESARRLLADRDALAGRAADLAAAVAAQQSSPAASEGKVSRQTDSTADSALTTLGDTVFSVAWLPWRGRSSVLGLLEVWRATGRKLRRYNLLRSIFAVQRKAGLVKYCQRLSCEWFDGLMAGGRPA